MTPSSVPTYPRVHTGPVIVLGSATSALEDLAAARKLFPRTPITAINFMYKWAPGCTHVCAADVGFFGLQLVARFPPPEGANRHAGCAKSYPLYAAPGRPYLWRGIKEGSSGMFAARVMRAIGYGPVVLAGVRIDQSGHLDGYRPGLHDPAFKGSAPSVAMLRETWEDARERGWLDGVCSMSGWTRELLGGPSPLSGDEISASGDGVR